MEGTDQQTKSKRKRTLLLTLSLAALVLVGGLLGMLLYISSSLQPMPASDREVNLNIQAGIHSGEIAQLLKEQGLIRDSAIFSYYLKVKNQGSRFQAGAYSMSPGITFEQIVEQLNKGQTVKEDTFRITVPEGYTLTQIADKIGQQKDLSRDVFLDKADHSSFHAPITTNIPENNKTKHRLEGYLFPETYEFKKGTTEEECIDRMLMELEKKLSTLPADWQEKLKQNKMDFHQMLTVASLVEREVIVDEERPIVAGIIYNRLKKGMPLQIDATIQYLLDKQKDRLYEKDLQIENPYNTYLHAGLPPGPIASPSLASIKAAIYSADTVYLFYVTKKDGSKGHLFAETFEQHQKNIAASKKTGK